jgi:hypothetical protein
MTRELLDRSLGAVPPSTVDVDQIVRRERRMTTARWSGIGMTAVAALTVTGVLVAAAHGAAPPPVGAPPPPATTGAAGSDNRFQLIALDKVTADGAATRLADALTTATAKASPETTWVADKPGDKGAKVIALFSDNDKETPYFYSGGGLTLTDGRQGLLNLYIGRTLQPNEDFPKKAPPLPLECGSESGCTVRTGPTGEKIFARDIAHGPGGQHRFNVRMALPGSFQLSLSSEDATFNDLDATPPLSLDELVSIAVVVAKQIKP